tara:strand:- start:6659 stop:6826 length:168 start_codon:yes stop_codon:yes gene_type:complete
MNNLIFEITIFIICIIIIFNLIDNKKHSNKLEKNLKQWDYENNVNYNERKKKNSN